ncbi:MAG TPA: class I SAM-dependent methyltransferase [Chloroflexia bacterium]|nr:class I SAM-dependent methyltransferase [Chloroflexia bacterium]
MTEQIRATSGWLRRQYATEDGLRARIETHLRYSERQDSWYDWLAALLPAPADGPLLDAGAGNGAVFAAVAPRLTRSARQVALDLSPGMLAAARQRARDAGLLHATFVNGDIQALPFAGGQFAVAMANHMLYHVPDIPRAVAELHRVLVPGGILIAATNARDSYPELFALHAAGIQALGLPLQPERRADVIGPFNLEEGAAFFTPLFSEVTVQTRRDGLVFTDVPGLLRYYLSGPIYMGAAGPDDPRVRPAQWDALADWMAARVGAAIAQDGAWRVDKTAGAFVARKDAPRGI